MNPAIDRVPALAGLQISPSAKLLCVQAIVVTQ
jgi:hypothetical protein